MRSCSRVCQRGRSRRFCCSTPTATTRPPPGPLEHDVPNTKSLHTNRHPGYGAAHCRKDRREDIAIQRVRAAAVLHVQVNGAGTDRSCFGRVLGELVRGDGERSVLPGVSSAVETGLQQHPQMLPGERQALAETEGIVLASAYGRPGHDPDRGRRSRWAAGAEMILPEIRDPRFVTVHRGGSLTDGDHHLLALWAASCAEHVLALFESAEPKDPRPRRAIEHARAWVRGEVAMMQARAAGGHAMGAARELRGAPRHAAYAAGQAGAVAHVAAHELGAAAYAIKAVRAAAPRGLADASGRRECRWQRDQLPDAIRELVLDDQRLRNDICWSAFDCSVPGTSSSSGRDVPLTVRSRG